MTFVFDATALPPKRTRSVSPVAQGSRFSNSAGLRRDKPRPRPDAVSGGLGNFLRDESLRYPTILFLSAESSRGAGGPGSVGRSVGQKISGLRSEERLEFSQ